MGLDKILSITGKPGLYELKAQTRSGFVAESLLDGRKISVSLRHNVSMLSEIAIYTVTEEVPLREIFLKIQEKENGGQAISHKESKDKMESYFREVLPDYDDERVYISDIKKVLQWYNLLQSKGMTDFSEPKKEEKSNEEPKEAESVAEVEAPKKAKKPAKKSEGETKAKKSTKAVVKEPAKEKKVEKSTKAVEKSPEKGKKSESAKKAADKKTKKEE